MKKRKTNTDLREEEIRLREGQALYKKLLDDERAKENPNPELVKAFTEKLSEYSACLNENLAQQVQWYRSDTVEVTVNNSDETSFWSKVFRYTGIGLVITFIVGLFNKD